MMDIMKNPELSREDFTVGDSGEEGVSSDQINPDKQEHHPKLSKRLPSIVVEATEGEVESGELRWPPDELRTSESPSQTSTPSQEIPAVTQTHISHTQSTGVLEE